MLAVTFIFFYYGNGVQYQREITQFVGVLILLAWLFLMIGFVTGLTLAKLHFV
jgi:hypothetical protein